MKANKLKLDLQLFAEDGDGGNGEGGNKEAISFESQAELDSWFDKKLEGSLNTARTKWQTETDRLVEEAKTEAEKMARMSTDEKLDVEAQKKADELAKREADITKRELKAESISQLTEVSLPVELVDVLNLTNAEDCQKSIDALKVAWDKANGSWEKAIETEVNERLKESAINPSTGGSGPSNVSSASRLAEERNKKDEVPTNQLWG